MKELERHVRALYAFEMKLADATARLAELSDDDERRSDTQSEIKLLKKAVRELHHEVETDAKELDELSPTESRPKDQPDADSLGANELQSLLIERETLAREYGPAHPKLIEANKKIELLRKLQADSANHEQLVKLQRELFPLLVEEELLLRTHGASHPKLHEIRLKIAATKKHFAE